MRTSEPALALRDDGAAVVAWRGGEQDDAVRAMTRPAAGAFGAEREVARGRSDGGFGTGFGAFFIPERDEPLAPLDEAGLGLRAILSATGRVALAWTAPRALPDAPLAPVVATGTLGGGVGAPSALGSPARSVAGVAALLLPGGEPAVAWVDNAVDSIGFGNGGLELPIGGGRIHLARAGASAGPSLPAPAARLRAPRLQRLYAEQSVRVSVRCAAACDVRAYIPRDGAAGAGDGASLPGGRSTELRLRPVGYAAVVPKRRGLVTVRARVSAPGSSEVRMLRLRVRIARRAELPIPRPLDARAVRRGRSIVVSWRTAFPARRTIFSVRPAKESRQPDSGASSSLAGRGRSRFRLTLRPTRPDALRRLVIAGTDYDGRHRRAVTVRVTR